MVIPDSLYVEADQWKGKVDLYEYSFRLVGVEDLADTQNRALVEKEADKRLKRLKRDGRQWKLEAVLRGSVIQGTATKIVFRVKRDQ